MAKTKKPAVFGQLENHDASIGAAEVQRTPPVQASQSMSGESDDLGVYEKLCEVRTLLRGIFPKNSEGTETLFKRVNELVKMFKPTGDELASSPPEDRAYVDSSVADDGETEYMPEDDEPVEVVEDDDEADLWKKTPPWK